MSRDLPLAQLASGPTAARPAVRRPEGRGERPSDLPRHLVDSHGRVIRDLRLSITDRCNLRCVYCMEPDVRFAAREEILDASELERVVRTAVGLGVEHVRLTGGEPTVRGDLLEIIARVAAIDGVRDLALTTNGTRASAEAMRAWKNAGLRRLTVSLDAVDEATFARMTRGASEGVSAAAVIAAIEGAVALGLGPVKVNAVVIRGRNEAEVPRLARLARELGVEMRFIEFMPLDSGHHWDPSLLVPASEIVDLASEAGELVPLGRGAASSTSEGFAFRDAPHVRIGVIAPVTRPFCGACSRLRVTADGKVRPCLFSLDEFDLRDVLRDRGLDERARDAALADVLLDATWRKQRGHGISAPDFRQPDRPMSAIGG